MSLSSAIFLAALLILTVLVAISVRWGVFMGNNKKKTKAPKTTRKRTNYKSDKKFSRTFRDRDFEASNDFGVETLDSNSPNSISPSPSHSKNPYKSDRKIAKTAVPFPSMDVSNNEDSSGRSRSGPLNENGCFMGGAYGQDGSYYSGYNGVEFRHPKVNDAYTELVIPKPVTKLHSEDLDELDEIFTEMLDAGAVKGKDHLVTNFEHQYLEKLRLWFGSSYHIFCQVSVGSSVDINIDVTDLPAVKRRTFAQKCHNMSFDFVLVDRATDRIVCAIELDDPTHKQFERKARDRRLDKVCNAADIPLFHITNINQKPDLNRMV